MLFEALPAQYGDCLLLTIPRGKTDKVRMLVDGGPGTVYEDTLRPKLAGLRKLDKLEPGDPLLIDAVMVSHIDDDHIIGIKKLFTAIVDGKDVPCQPKWLFYNSFDSLLGEGHGGVARIFGGPATLASLAAGELKFQGAQPDADTLAILQSYQNGNLLASAAARVEGCTVNPPKQQLIGLDPGNTAVYHLGDATMTIIGPMQDQVDNLQKQWDEFTADGNTPKWETRNLEGTGTFDKTVTNLSSIVALLETGKRRILLCGDGLDLLIIEGLEKAGILDPGKTLHVDVLKVPHHGSFRNCENGLFRRITADHYIFSANGKYANPDHDTLLELEKARKTGKFDVYLTYPARECDDNNKAEFESKKSNKGKTFDVDKQGISPIIERWKGSRITVHDGEPIAIEL